MRKYLVESLRERLERAAEDRRPEEAYSLLDEIEVARELAAQALNRWEAAQNSKDLHLRASTEALARDALAYVGSMVQQGAKVRAMFVGSLDFEHLEFVLNQVVRIVGEELTDEDAVKRVADRVRNIRVVSNNSGQNYAPAMARAIREAAAAAFATVPIIESTTDAEDGDAAAGE